MCFSKKKAQKKEKKETKTAPPKYNAPQPKIVKQLSTMKHVDVHEELSFLKNHYYTNNILKHANQESENQKAGHSGANNLASDNMEASQAHRHDNNHGQFGQAGDLYTFHGKSESGVPSKNMSEVEGGNVERQEEPKSFLDQIFSPVLQPVLSIFGKEDPTFDHKTGNIHDESHKSIVAPKTMEHVVKGATTMPTARTDRRNEYFMTTNRLESEWDEDRYEVATHRTCQFTVADWQSGDLDEPKAESWKAISGKKGKKLF